MGRSLNLADGNLTKCEKNDNCVCGRFEMFDRNEITEWIQFILEGKVKNKSLYILPL